MKIRYEFVAQGAQKAVSCKFFKVGYFLKPEYPYDGKYLHLAEMLQERLLAFFILIKV